VPDLASLRAKCARLEVVYGGETIVVFYRPTLVTEETQAILRTLQLDGDFRPLFAELERVLMAWDLTSDGIPLPLTSEGFTMVGIGVVGQITNAIVRDVGNPTWVASPPSPTGSSNGSSPTASSVPAPTTSISSSPPNGHTSTPPTSSDFRATSPSGTPGSAG